MTITDTAQQVHSLSNYVCGRDVDSDKWVYTLAPRAVLDDSFATLKLKRRLERGETAISDVPPGVVVGRVAMADKATVEQALHGARLAAQEWRSVPMRTRLHHWYALLHDVLLEHQDEIVWALTSEGHPIDLARWEVSGMYEMTRPEAADYLGGQLWREFPAPGRRNIVRRQPDGVVCVNPPANAPLVSALLGALSIAAGNAVVVRAPRSVPFGVTYVLRKLVVPTLEAVGAPPGLLSIVCGHPAPMLDAWLASPHVNDIMYFGDVPSGFRMESRCVEAGKKPILELAGNDAVVVWADADLERAADALAESFYGSGQLCMVPNQAIVHPAVADRLIALVVARAEAMRPGYPDEEGVLLSPVMRHDKFDRFLADATEKGATIVTGGKGMQLDGTVDSAGFFLQPTVVRIDGLRRAREFEAVKHETFFPLLPIVVPEAIDEADLLTECVEFLNTNLYGLRNSVWAGEQRIIDRFVAETVNGGLLKINDSHVAFAAPLPSHGGTGMTGGVFGEANYPVLRTTHLQGVSIASPDAQAGGPRAGAR
ncbi:aldehyde dehydrogenase family protein [Nocardia sp. NPDC003482]